MLHGTQQGRGKTNKGRKKTKSLLTRGGENLDITISGKKLHKKSILGTATKLDEERGEKSQAQQGTRRNGFGKWDRKTQTAFPILKIELGKAVGLN